MNENRKTRDILECVVRYTGQPEYKQICLMLDEC